MLIDTELVAITILLIIFLLASTLAWRSAPRVVRRLFGPLYARRDGEA